MNIIRLDSSMAKPVWAINARKKMKELGIIQSSLLDLFEVTTAGAVGHYFNGARDPKIEHVGALARHLNVPIAELLGHENEVRKLQASDAEHLTDALQFLIGMNELTDNEIKVFFTVYQKIGADNIIMATTALSRAGDEADNKMAAILDIQKHIKKAS